MKIALLTLPLYTNYGSVLQAFALKSYLERFGHDVWLIDNHRQEPPVGNLFLRTVLRRAVESLFHHKEIFAELNDARTRGYKMAEIEKFIYRHLSPRTFPVYDEEDFIALRDEGFDLFIVGSDQVWRPRYAKKITRYFFSFLEGTSLRRISYAASFGTTACEYTPAEREQCARLITGFSGVSVRESSAIGQCRDYFGYDGARQVLDPTLLLTAEDYAPFLKGTPASEETLFCYLFRLKGGMRRALGRLASQRGLRILRRTDRTSESRGRMPDIEQWLTELRNARHVVTDSFHACAFCILFHKSFAACINRRRGSARVASLLELLGLSNRIMASETDLAAILDSPIDWSAVDRKLEARRADSREFLARFVEMAPEPPTPRG